MESILMSIKKLLGIEDDYVQFDADVRMNINAAFSTLTQIGVGPSEGFLISDKSTMWSEFLGERKDSEFVKMYIYLKVRLGFDPPQNGFLVDNINKQIAEIEWRLQQIHDI